MSTGNYIQTINRMKKVIARQESEIDRLKKELASQNKNAFEKIDILQKTIYWLNNRNFWWRVFNKQPKDGAKDTA